ncbi:PREDICTED: uncharacterized protein LOC105569174 [Vollenhovia emeryi]|uniref:uncharacterized protein LOC105569174 n=1 Tax=Vollenhovia emeryi TaxID=411798 RepID=UPI0005F48A3D|nr:PREDICTED: uncharacterized protein LOC105569174 [Vollenhovia emeryi]
MANFAKEQLMKYGWREGKGLGKDENGITKPVRLATNQNKAGLGYNETDPWRELYDKTIKAIKIESGNNTASLSVDSTKNALCFGREKTVLPKFRKSPSFVELRLEKYTDEYAFPPKLNPEQRKTMRRDLASSGKLKRIAEQDRKFLYESYSPEQTLNVNTDLERVNDIVDWMTNATSDVFTSLKVNKHERGEFENMLKYGLNWLTQVSPETVKRLGNRRRNKEQLSTCNFEGRSEKHESMNNRMLCQRMEKNNVLLEEIMAVLDCLRDDTDKSDQFSIVPSVNLNDFRKKRTEYFSQETKREKLKEFRTFYAYDTEMGKYKVELCSELRNSIEGSGVIDEQWNDLKEVIIDLKEEKRQKCGSNLIAPINSNQCGQYVLKPGNRLHEKDELIKEPMRQIRKFDRQTSSSTRAKSIREMINKDNVNSLIKNLTTMGLTKEVNANTIRRKPTQTHLTPV